MRVVLSSSAAVRLDAARRFVLEASPDTEFLIAAASRAAADDFARTLARARGATFGMHRLSLTQLAARLAAPVLARDRLSPTTPLNWDDGGLGAGGGSGLAGCAATSCTLKIARQSTFLQRVVLSRIPGSSW